MQTISKSDSLSDYQKKEAHNRRVVQQAKAVYKRAKNAGIPDKFLRIGRKDFLPLLDPHYHKDNSKKDRKKLTSFIYDHPLKLLKKEFVIIDGGNIVSRKKAGFAILFRLICCDRIGMFKNGTELAHQLQSIQAFSYGISRNDITEELRQADVLFISEVSKKDFIKNFETGRFFDEILSYRDDHSKPTIISLITPMPQNVNMENEANIMTEMDQFGQYMCSVSQADLNNDERFLRIRVKTNG